MKFYNDYIQTLKENEIFVFGSNPEGRHGAGSAKLAKQKFGAIYGKGRGIQGRSYALITKNLTPNFIEKETNICYKKAGEKSLTKEQIKDNIKELYLFASNNTDLDFLIAYTFDNKNLNGYSSLELIHLFDSFEIPNNIVFHISFKQYFDNKIW